MKIKALKKFPVAPDGINTFAAVPGDEMEVPDEIGEGLVTEGLAEEIEGGDEEVVIVQHIMEVVEDRVDHVVNLQPTVEQSASAPVLRETLAENEVMIAEMEAAQAEVEADEEQANEEADEAEEAEEAEDDADKTPEERAAAKVARDARKAAGGAPSKAQARARQAERDGNATERDVRAAGRQTSDSKKAEAETKQAEARQKRENKDALAQSRKSD